MQIDCLRGIYGFTEVATFGTQVVSRLRTAIPSSGVLFGNYDLRKKRSEFVADHPDAYKVPLDQIIATLPSNHQHPYWPHYLKTHDPRATKLSDFMGRREFHSKGFIRSCISRFEQREAAAVRVVERTQRRPCARLEPPRGVDVLGVGVRRL